MSLESPQPHRGESFYKERISSNGYLDRMVGEIDCLVEGEGVLNLSEQDNSELLEYESELEYEFYEYWKTKVRSFTVDLDWLVTEKGREFFTEKTGIQEIPKDKDLLPEFLYQHTEILSDIEPKTRKKISGEGTNFCDEKIFESFSECLDKDVDLASLDIEYTEKTTLLLDPEKWVEKDKSLRLFKDRLKDEYKKLEGDNSDRAEAKRIVLNLYAHRVNIAIAGLHSERRMTAKKANEIGYENLTKQEKMILGEHNQDNGEEGNSPFVTDQHFRELQTSRLDKFSHGVSSEIENSQRLQVGSELEKIADKLGKAWLESSTKKKELIESHGIDSEKLLEENIIPSARKEMVERHLNELGILSVDPDYDPDRDGPAEDNMFQVYVRPGSKNAAVNGKQRVVILADKNISIDNTLSVESGHEVTHAIQNINADLIPLKLFERIGGGGNPAFSEGGAMYVQDKITKELFGYEAKNHPHYIKAMAARLKGAKYPETVAVFYKSSMEPLVIMKDNGNMSKEEYDKESLKALKLAINRCKRIFGGSRLDSEGSHLTSSKATVYLEQNIVFEKLKERGLDKLFLIKGMSLENIVALMKLGYLKADDIREPDYDYIRNAWSEVKSKYEKTKV